MVRCISGFSIFKNGHFGALVIKMYFSGNHFISCIEDKGRLRIVWWIIMVKNYLMSLANKEGIIEKYSLSARINGRSDCIMYLRTKGENFPIDASAIGINKIML